MGGGMRILIPDYDIMQMLHALAFKTEEKKWTNKFKISPRLQTKVEI